MSRFLVLDTICRSRFFMFIIIYLCYIEFCNTYLFIDCDISSKFSFLYVIFEQICNMMIQSRFNSRNLHLVSNNLKLEISFSMFFQILLLSYGVIYFLLFLLSDLSTQFEYVKFNTDLNIHNQKKKFYVYNKLNTMTLYFILLGIYLFEVEKEQIILLFIELCPNFLKIFTDQMLKKIKVFRSATSASLVIYIFSISISPIACILCLIIFQIWCCTYIKQLNHWLTIFLILLSNDIHMNPGPQYRENFFTFMSWNLNSLAKKDFERVDLIEAHNANINTI